MRDLVVHVASGARAAALAVDGAPLEQVVAGIDVDDFGTELTVATSEALGSQEAAFAVPGARDRVVEHRVGVVPAEVLLGFRVGDAVVHGWDLRRALSMDEHLEPDLVDVAWGVYEPKGQALERSGRFAARLPEDGDAPLQSRLLRLVGRQPEPS